MDVKKTEINYDTVSIRGGSSGTVLRKKGIQANPRMLGVVKHLVRSKPKPCKKKNCFCWFHEKDVHWKRKDK